MIAITFCSIEKGKKGKQMAIKWAQKVHLKSKFYPNMIFL